MKRIGRILLIGCAGLIVCTIVLLAALKLFETRVPPPGEMVEVNGTRMRIECTGPRDTGLPTVILESGATGLDAQYYWLQQALSQQVRTCNYDRVGTAWSEDRDEPHDAAHFVPQLHTLLQKAGVKLPYVLAGHSLGGPIIRVFAKSYPAEVHGLVFLDSSHPDQEQKLPVFLQDPRRLEKTLRIIKAVEFAAAIGVTHVFNPVAPRDAWFATLPAERQKQILSLTHRRQSYRGMREEAEAIPATFRQGGEAKEFGDLPLLVISAGDLPAIPDFSQQQLEETKAVFGTLQEDLATLSSRGKRIVLSGTHMSLVVQKENAEKVAAATLGLVHAAAAYQPPR